MSSDTHCPFDTDPISSSLAMEKQLVYNVDLIYGTYKLKYEIIW